MRLNKFFKSEAKGYIEAQKEYETQLHNQQNEIQQLKQQLAEKDKEIESLKKADNIWLDSYQNELDTLRQNQTQLAIHELEKVKTLIQNAINFENPNFVEVYDAINKQINDLRGEKDATS